MDINNEHSILQAAVAVAAAAAAAAAAAGYTLAAVIHNPARQV